MSRGIPNAVFPNGLVGIAGFVAGLASGGGGNGGGGNGGGGDLAALHEVTTADFNVSTSFLRLGNLLFTVNPGEAYWFFAQALFVTDDASANAGGALGINALDNGSQANILLNETSLNLTLRRQDNTGLQGWSDMRDGGITNTALRQPASGEFIDLVAPSFGSPANVMTAEGVLFIDAAAASPEIEFRAAHRESADTTTVPVGASAVLVELGAHNQ